MTLFLDGCRGTTLSHVRGGEDAVAGRSLRSVGRRSTQDALRYAVARHRRRPGLSPLQLPGRLYLSVSPSVQMQGLPPAVLGDQRNPARVRKLPVRTLLTAFSLFVNAAKGISSLQLSRYLGLHAKTAFVLLHKLRCALTANFATTRLSGVVEIDGGWFGGHVRPENHRLARVDRRRRQHQNGKRRCVVVMRQRGGPTVTAVVKHEAEAVPIIRRRIARGSIVHADEARAWDDLHASFEMKRINHREAYSKDGACTNQAESYISRLRRAEIGQHHHIAGPHLGQYAGEMAWREDVRRNATGTQFHACGRLALGRPPSRAWAGYWQRHLRREEVRQAA